MMLERRTKLVQFFVSESEKDKFVEICEKRQEPLSVGTRKTLNAYIWKDIFREV